MATNGRIAHDRRRGRGTDKIYHLGISTELAACTIVDERIPADTLVKCCRAETDMTVGHLSIIAGERFWLVAVAAVNPNFPHRFYAVISCNDGEDYQASCGNTKVSSYLGAHFHVQEKVVANPVADVIIELVKQHRLHRRAAAASQMAQAS